MSSTSRYAAFLRGMNVGGHRIGNAELRDHCTAIGLQQVATFRASGNVLFSSDLPGTPRRRREALASRIEQGLAAALGYAVPTFVRSAEEVLAIAALDPFPPARVLASRGKLQVAMLASPPSRAARGRVLGLAGESDLLALADSELYWLPSGGVLESPLDMKAIERALGPMTMRTKGTIEQIASRHLAG